MNKLFRPTILFYLLFSQSVSSVHQASARSHKMKLSAVVFYERNKQPQLKKAVGPKDDLKNKKEAKISSQPYILRRPGQHSRPSNFPFVIIIYQFRGIKHYAVGSLVTAFPLCPRIRLHECCFCGPYTSGNTTYRTNPDRTPR